MHHPAEYINSDIYPLDNPGSDGWKHLVDQCRSLLDETGVCILKEFVQKKLINKMAHEADQYIHLSHFSEDSHNVFFQDDDEFLPANHPLRIKEKTSLNSIPYDLMDPKDALHQLYNWDPLMNFLSPILGHTLYRMADPMAALTINCMDEGQNHGWHYDESQVTITLLIQKPISGGLFQCVPNLRKKDFENFANLGTVLSGDQKDVVTLDVEPGDLLIFAGFYSLHRVTPVKGEKRRYVGTLCYKDKPNIFNSPEVQQLFYGRINQS
tara:strand:- start:1326 stop:2126 length:801 start_codon:yes stop_codon:yes gene_type:complete